MASDIEKKIYDVRDSIKMQGIGDKLERLVRDTEQSIGLNGAKLLSEDELDMVAGGRKVLGEINGRIADGYGGKTPTSKGGLTC